MTRRTLVTICIVLGLTLAGSIAYLLGLWSSGDVTNTKALVVGAGLFSISFFTGVYFWAWLFTWPREDHDSG